MNKINNNTSTPSSAPTKPPLPPRPKDVLSTTSGHDTLSTSSSLSSSEKGSPGPWRPGPTPISKKRENLLKAISEARKKLETLGSQQASNGMSNSKSIANLHTASSNMTNNNKFNSFTESDAMKRSISLSDISFGPRRGLRTPTSEYTNGNAPLWERNQTWNAARKQLSSGQRSPSIANLMTNSDTKSLKWNSRMRESLSPAPGRISAPASRWSEDENRRHIRNGGYDSSDEESSCSDRRHTSARPVTPPKPSILRQVRRGSASHTPSEKLPPRVLHKYLPPEKTFLQTPENPPQSLTRSGGRKLWNSSPAMRGSKSEFNLSWLGRETPVRRLSNASSTLSGSSSGLWAPPTQAAPLSCEKLDLSMTNPANIPLTLDLCKYVVDELIVVSKYAVKLHQRASSSGNSIMSDLLSDGIKKAYATLSSNNMQNGLNSTSVSSHGSTSIEPNDQPSLPPDCMLNTEALLQQYSDKLLSLVEQRIANKIANNHNKNHD